MDKEKYFTTGEFAKLCKTTKETLRHYKDIDILKPVLESSNGYLYYESEQFYDYYLIYILKNTGTPLSEIKAYMDHQSPGSVLELLKIQQERLKEIKQEIEQMEHVVHNTIFNIETGLSDRFSSEFPTVEYFEEEHLLALPVDALEESTEDLAIIQLLHKYDALCQQYSLISEYQTGAILQSADFLSGKQTVSHVYTKIHKPIDHPYYYLKPSGYYLTLIDRGHWDLSSAYQRLTDYIKESNTELGRHLFVYDLSGYLLNGIEENTITLIMAPLLLNEGENLIDKNTFL